MFLHSMYRLRRCQFPNHSNSGDPAGQYGYTFEPRTTTATLKSIPIQCGALKRRQEYDLVMQKEDEIEEGSPDLLDIGAFDDVRHGAILVEFPLRISCVGLDIPIPKAASVCAQLLS